jgi:catechol 2,3-dioxygenase-like lactoylglutathione lyase family enzyme
MPKPNHTIVHTEDREASAAFWVEVLGLPPAKGDEPFLEIETDNDVILALMATGRPEVPQHYAFLVTEDEFDQIFGRVKDRGLDHWADPHKSKQGEINTHDGGRGVYFDDPNGHLLELITVPYGGW